MLPEELAKPFHELHHRLMEAGDGEAGRKAMELAEKRKAGRVAVAFSGHFSAGKSSLLNALCGKELLPTGPVPMSANLVRIRHGRVEAVFAADGNGEARLSPGALAEACLDGTAAYRRIDIRTPSPLLEGGLELLDTPGVDSTDEAHREATEASLHLADVVFFVTDYNHVLSETNLFFLRQLEEMHKPYAVVVNQVDKHRPGEMPFAAYRQSVEQAMGDWQLKPLAVLYVSVKVPGHPLSEWSRLIRLLERLKEHAEPIVRTGTARSALAVIRQHAEWRYPSDAREGEGDGDAALAREVAEAADRLSAIRQKQEDILREPEVRKEQFVSELAALIDNAQLMTADVRELAAAYLETRKPGFKVGLLFAEAKTKEERARRLAAFRGRLAEHVESRLVWHLNQLLGPRFETDVTEDELADAVRDGAVVSGTYALTYCQMVESAVKARYRRKALAVYEETVLAENRKAAEGKRAELAAEEAEAEAALEEAKRRLAIREARQALIDEWSAPFRDAARLSPFPAEWAASAHPEPEDRAEEPSGFWPEAAAAGAEEPAPLVPETGMAVTPAGVRADKKGEGDGEITGGAASGSDEDAFRYRSLLEQAARRLEAAAEWLRDAPALAEERTALLARADKLRRHRFTAALFGAFSAGKSSFANALLGAPVLPVSPNPTTAAINSVLPPDGDHPHGTALIRMKSEAELMDDLRHSLSMLGLPPEEIDSPGEAALLLDKALQGSAPARGRAHASFIRAAAEGYAAVKDKLGTAWRADQETYRQYVAEERKSCFVKSIDLFLASPFADQGVVLVDTPGADSIHARHTGVTFNYIRQADAILFVTYYNHAFSRADRQFLEQLGRVKDAFEMDRMFFLVNAADLADSEAELEQVLDHVEKELVRHGIRQPRLFAVSSREALEAKRTGDGRRLDRSGFPAFESAFARFASGELAETFLAAADRELGRIHDRACRLAEQSKLAAGERQERVERIRAESPGLLRRWRDEAAGPADERLRRELAELVHHVKQRCFFRFGDRFADAFHPSVLQRDGRDPAVVLMAAWNELVQAITTDVTGEMLATALRLEQFAVREAVAWREEAAGRLSAIFPEWTAGAWEPDEAGLPDADKALDLEPVPAGQLVRRFRNARSFFEGGGREAMREWLEGLLMDAVARYADRYAETLSGYCGTRLARLLDEARDELDESLSRFARVYAADDSSGPDWAALAGRLAAVREDAKPGTVLHVP